MDQFLTLKRAKLDQFLTSQYVYIYIYIDICCEVTNWATFWPF